MAQERYLMDEKRQNPPLCYLNSKQADRHLNHWQLTRIDSMKWGARSSTLPLSHPISYFI